MKLETVNRAISWNFYALTNEHVYFSGIKNIENPIHVFSISFPRSIPPTPHILWHQFVRPMHPSTLPPPKQTNLLLRRPDSKNRRISNLESLPIEIIDIILSYLSPPPLTISHERAPHTLKSLIRSDAAPYVALALTSRTMFYLVTTRHLHWLHAQHAAPLAGSPVALLSADSLPALIPKCFDPYWPPPGDMNGYGNEIRSLCVMLYKRFRRPRGREMEEEAWRAEGVRWREVEGECGISEGWWTWILREGFEAPAFVPGGWVWVLRNLDKKVFVRSDALAGVQWEWKIEGREGDGLTLTDVLLLRTVVPSIRTSWNAASLRMGDWAGDRLEVITLDVHSKEKRSEEWVDVTENFIDDMKTLISSIITDTD